MASTFLSVCLPFISLCCTDGYLTYRVSRCEFNSTELNHIEFTESYFYNGQAFARFSSRVGKYVGYTEFGLRATARWNNNTALLNTKRDQKSTYCQTNTRIWYKNILSKSAEPHVILHAETPSAGGHPAMLVCRVYDFYPKQIRVFWLRDGQEVTSGVTSTDEMANGDWYYQIHSYLEYTPRTDSGSHPVILALSPCHREISLSCFKRSLLDNNT